MKKYKLVWVLLMLLAFVSRAQQFPQFTNYVLNPFIINPAYAGTTEYYDIKASYRDQWQGIKGSPQTFYVTAHGHVGKEHPRFRGKSRYSNSWHHGLGATVLRDQTGPTNFTKINITYAYDFTLSKGLRLSFAMSGGLKQFGFDANQTNLNDGSHVESATNLISTLPDINAGAFLYHKDYFIGVSVQNLIFNQFNKSAYGLDKKYYSQNNQFDQHIFLQAGYVFNTGHFHIIPSSVLKIVPGIGTPSLDINAKVRYANFVWGGLNYRTGDAVSIFAGALFHNMYEISYAYDYGVGTLSSNFGGSHEILLGLRIHPKYGIPSPSDYW